jgi:DNA-binding response OmpR family regulator
MSRIFLADPSLHAQRMGGEILKAEGFAVATATDGITALAMLKEFDPLVILADVLLPGKSGYELCNLAKANGNAVAVVLTAGAQAAIDSDRAQSAGSDGTLSKPFEATPLIAMVKKLAISVQEERRRRAAASAKTGHEVDRERVEAAVTIALESATPALIREITERVLVALKK